jgi:mannitol-specific phosphotransferase system IIBC component
MVKQMKPHNSCRKLRGLVTALAACITIAGCGVEAMGSAATGAAIKKQEVEQGQAQKEAIQKQLQQALDQNQQRQQALEQANK